MKEQKTGNRITEMVFILDRSGSMAGLESDTIGGFNGMITKQKKEEGKAFVTTVLFDNVTETLHDRIPLSDIRPLTDRDYTVRGCTALLDAVGETVEHIRSIHKYARPEDVPAHTIFVITTDGMENASRKYTYKAVKQLIEQQKECGWEFLFIGANIDAAEVAERVGIERENTANYCADSVGTATVFGALAAPLSAMRKGMKANRCWAEEIEADLADAAAGRKRRKK
ncbi:MAG: VWA domain-containing protein [Oscillospiraceae bacterium]|nr:VWA domain-containing protein [Oscillospiraceae bacterium]